MAKFAKSPNAEDGGGSALEQFSAFLENEAFPLVLGGVIGAFLVYQIVRWLRLTLQSRAEERARDGEFEPEQIPPGQ